MATIGLLNAALPAGRRRFGIRRCNCSLDNLVSPGPQLGWDGQAERFRGIHGMTTQG